MEQQPTSIILQGTLNGDRKCQELLYRQFYRYGMSICLRYAADRNEAVEVLNDGFMKVFANIGQYDVHQPFKAWFRRILINTAINHYKKNARHQHDALDMVPERPDIQQDALAELGYQEVIRAIQALPLAYRTVFNLYVIEGYNHEEIAGMLHISKGTSKSNLSRARANLRNVIIKNQEEGATSHE